MKNDEKDLLDIVFETRNKTYGAYLLRRNYPTTMRNALFWTIGGLVAAFVVPYLLAAANRTEPYFTMNREIIFETPPDIENPPVVPPPVEVAPPPVSKPVIKFVPPLVLENNQVPDDPKMPDLDTPINGEIGKKTTAGDPTANVPFEEPIDLDEKKKVEVVKTAPPEAPRTFVESMPQFPGGETALLKYLAKNIHYPEAAREANIQGRVFLTFVVEKSGEITDVRIERGLGGGIEKEAIRVVRSMPRWKPGNQNGNLVRVRMNLPILFKLQ